MTKLEQAARQALKALDKAERQLGYNNIVPHSCYKDAITALREALAEQAEQEPVKRFTSDDVKVAFENGYAAAVFVAGVAKEAEQEPVAWANPHGGYMSARYLKDFATGLERETYTVPLYAAPVRTKDLTDDDIDQVRDKTWCFSNSLRDFARAVIAADREKNK